MESHLNEEIIYLSVEDVELIHWSMVELYGGIEGRDVGKLEALLAMPMSGFADFDRYPLIEEKAAIYHYYLVSGHAFKDGNKRTSYMSAFTFLDLNGYDLIAEDVFNWTIQIAKEDRQNTI